MQGSIYASSALRKNLAERSIDPGGSDRKSPADLLSDRELEVFQLYGRGLETKQVAKDLRLSIKTVEAYTARIKEKLGLGNFNEFIREAVVWQQAEKPD